MESVSSTYPHLKSVALVAKLNYLRESRELSNDGECGGEGQRERRKVTGYAPV